MFQARTHAEIDGARAGVQRISGLSDSILKLGPFGIGLDGVLAWVPIVGTVYSFAAGVMIVALGWRARAPISTLMTATTILTARTAVTAAGEVIVPIMPVEVLVDFFRAHKWAADMIVKSIDETVYVEGRHHPSNPAFVETRERIRSGEERRRVVFMG